MFWMKYLLIAGMMHLVENKALSMPSAPDSDGQCRDGYLEKRLHLCCSLCEPGFHQKIACTGTSDTVCVRCDEGTFLEKANRARNCFKCKQCREDRGLIYTQSCSTSSDAKCACKKGTYCALRERGWCSECTAFTTCPPGQGVSKQVAEDSDVSCSPCPPGTFSDKTSYTETCQQHTDCESQGKDTLYPGNATSNRECGQIRRLPATGTPTATITTATITTATTTTAPSTTRTQATSNTFITANTHMGFPSLTSKTTEHKDSVGIIVGAVSAVVLVALIGLLAFLLIQKRNGDTNNNIKKETSKPLHGTSVLNLQGSCCSHPPPEQQCLLREKDSSSPSLSSSSSGGTDHRSLTDPEHAAHSRGPVIHGSQKGSACHDNPQASSTSFKVEFSATISTTQLPPSTYLYPVLTTPTTDSTSSNLDLPLSKEEERLDATKEMHAAVQESGKVVC
ncbi:hypothetical protein SKAU_G00112860 [Synaphobranchus kaupii]|uniref:TNFR-Cys domain-containing protein n=1 Tax=Synaphobranchus kaupii TaxID=118154 RepID=A0A9Q1G0P2_SYNKA|nr:hypothetical protein SKAU_G00112860 [Synaphobranchus kaupii]